PAAELPLALKEGDPHTALGQPGRGGQPGDPPAGHHHVRPARQPPGVKLTAGGGMPDRPAVPPGPRGGHPRSPTALPGKALPAREGRLARNVCTMPRCQPGTVSLCTPVNPRPAGMITAVHTACHTARAAAESATEYSCTARVPPGRSSPRRSRSTASGSATLRIRYAARMPSNGLCTPATASRSTGVCTNVTDGGHRLA